MDTETATATATFANPPASRRRFTPVHGPIVSWALTLAVSLLPTVLSVRGHRALVISALTVAMWVCELPPGKAFGGYSDPNAMVHHVGAVARLIPWALATWTGSFCMPIIEDDIAVGAGTESRFWGPAFDQLIIASDSAQITGQPEVAPCGGLEVFS